MFVLVGLSQKSAPLEVREKAFVPEDQVSACVQRLIDHDLIESGVMLSTCHRTELYASAATAGAGDRLVEAFAWWPHELPAETWQRHAYQLDGREAMRHLFEVAAGLDSMVIGEGQVIGQLKRAIALAFEAGTLDPTLQVVLRGALRAGKRVRHETGIAMRPVSVAHAGVTQAAAALGSLHGRGVLLIGTGEMSEVALRLFRNQDLGALFIASRSVDRATRTARPLGATAIAIEAVDDIIDRVDVILASSSVPAPLFDATRLHALQARRAGRPLVVIDIGVPRNVDPGAAMVPGVRLFNIDDLQAAADRGLDERRLAVPDALRIVDEELERTQAALTARDVSPILTALVARADEWKRQELARSYAELASPDTATRQALDDLADRLTRKFVDAPLRHLRDAPEPQLDARVLGDAFDLHLERGPDPT